MPTRYQQLRLSIANLAAPADAQAAYLDRLHSRLTDGASAAGYGNDELGLEFDDSYGAVGHMLDCGEISQKEIDAAKPLDRLLQQWSSKTNAGFWTREALFTDPRWHEVRQCAQNVLEAFPDEPRESDWTRRHA